MARVQKVAVIGGGIIGTSAALLALEKVPNIEVTLMADKFSPFTTGDGSAGLWKPYLIGNVEPSRMRFWCMKTFQFLMDIFKSPDSGKYGVGLLPCYDISTTPMEKPVFSDVFLDWRYMNEKELALFPSRFKYGAYLTTFFVECPKLLPIMLKKIKSKGGKIIKRKVNDIAELYGEYDVVINCCGLGANQLVSDPTVKPIRGQVMRVKAPWIKYAVMDEDFYILPNSEETICGGTHQEGDWNLDPDPVDSKKIWEGCTELIPNLKNAQVLREWVGLRPGRSEPRLERETLETEKGNIEVIHNYGHGGSGITVGWGCAHEVVGLLEEVLNEIYLTKLSSKL